MDAGLAAKLSFRDENSFDPEEKELELMVRLEGFGFWLALKDIFCGTLLMTEGRTMVLVPKLDGLNATVLAGRITPLAIDVVNSEAWTYRCMAEVWFDVSIEANKIKGKLKL